MKGYKPLEDESTGGAYGETMNSYYGAHDRFPPLTQESMDHHSPSNSYVSHCVDTQLILVYSFLYISPHRLHVFKDEERERKDNDQHDV